MSIKDSQSTGGDDAGETYRRSRVESKRFIYYSIQIWYPLDLLRIQDRFIITTQEIVQFLLKFSLNAGIEREVVDYRTGRTVQCAIYHLKTK